jgi:hypothetical protein
VIEISTFISNERYLSELMEPANPFFPSTD